tara:strand:+ start:5973 stop:6476 length:504 start_codon:yes stop_codon:yes gene_type:complete
MNLFREGKVSYRLFVAIAIAAILVFAGYQQSQLQYQENDTTIGGVRNDHREDLRIRVNGLPLKTQLAESFIERATGLSDHESLNQDEAMLFVFETDNQHSFWMKDMDFAIDIIWLNQNKEIIFIEDSVSPDTYPESFAPDTAARYVVEVAAGFVQQNMISVGDQFTW